MIHTLNWYRRHHLEHPDLALWPRAAAVTRGDDGYDLWVDAELDGCEPLQGTFGLIGRRSRAQDALFVLRPCRRYGDLQCVLPVDAHEGDLLAFVIARPVALHDIRRRPQHPERLH